MVENKEIAVIEKKVSPLVLKAEKHEITDAKSMGEAVTMLSEMKKTEKLIKDSKEKLTKPINEALKEIRKRYKPIEDMFEAGISALRRTMTDYQTAESLKAAEKKDAIAERVGDGKGKLKVETAVRQMEEVNTPANSVATDAGLVKFRKVKKFEVMDMTLLPMKYHLADEVAIRKAMNEGVQLEGVRYYEEQVPANFT